LENGPGEITQLLIELQGGNRLAEERLIQLIYKELHRIAANRLRNESDHHSWQPTELVNEAYLRLARIENIDWKSRAHFFAVSATIMRRILVDHARANLAKKRGDGANTISLTEAVFAAPRCEPEILALDEALGRLAELDERQSKIVELRFFAGLSEEETGNVLSISTRTVKRDWRAAKAWLFAELKCG
jgi:RNA polymerase sigma factor (TIGR02999 family)